MQEYLRVKPDELKNHGKLVDNTLYLSDGVHVRDRNPKEQIKNELFIKEKQKNPYEKKVIQ